MTADTARRGPGRPSLSDDEPTVRLPATRMPASLRDWVLAQPGGSVAEKVRGVLESAREDDCERLGSAPAGCGGDP